MHIPTMIRRLTLPVGALLLVTACAGGQSASWTYAPLGPSANPSAAAPSSAASPAASGGTTLTVETTQGAPLAFAPKDMTVTPGASVTVTYTNNSNQLHNINFFDGTDNTAPSLGATEQKTGPNDVQSVSFTAPTKPGDYLFWCDVHTTTMEGTLHVQ